MKEGWESPLERFLWLCLLGILAEGHGDCMTHIHPDLDEAPLHAERC